MARHLSADFKPRKSKHSSSLLLSTSSSNPIMSNSTKIVVTGSNGYLGTHVLKELLSSDSPRDVLVKAVVRSEKSSKIVQDLFEKEIQDGKLKIKIVEDMLEPGAFDEVLRGEHVSRKKGGAIQTSLEQLRTLIDASCSAILTLTQMLIMLFIWQQLLPSASPETQRMIF